MRSARRRVLTKISVERCCVDQSGNPIVDLGPHFVGRNWAKLAGGNFDA